MINFREDPIFKKAEEVCENCDYYDDRDRLLVSVAIAIASPEPLEQLKHWRQALNRIIYIDVLDMIYSHKKNLCEELRAMVTTEIKEISTKYCKDIQA